MKTRNRITKWGPAAGVLAIGVLAFSMSLEGAPAPRKAGRPSNPAAKPNQSGLAPARSASREPASNKLAVSPADASAVQRTVPTATPGAATASDDDQDTIARLKYGHIPQGGIQVAPQMVVDYRDDEGSRLRQAGLLVGPYRPRAQVVAAANCSFDVDCDDCDPCTQDTCNIPVGGTINSGVCINTTLSNGAEGGCSDGLCCNGRETCQTSPAAVCVGGLCNIGSRQNEVCTMDPAGDAFCKSIACENPGSGSGTFDAGSCQYPCTQSGQKCNEDINLCRPPCTGANTCSLSLGPCTTSVDCTDVDPDEDNYCLNCQDGLVCNGVEVCTNPGPNGVCESVINNPCGPGAQCGEKMCHKTSELDNTIICTTDSDCPYDSQTQTNIPCDTVGPVCLPGRCCDNGTAEPDCDKRYKSVGASPASASCDAQAPARVWYATDRGSLPTAGVATACPTPAIVNNPDLPPDDRTLCPKYSSGIAPLIPFSPKPRVISDTEIAVLAGPFSDSPCDFQDIGDDYHFENEQYMALEKFRWIGAGGGRLTIELYAENGAFIEDIVTGAITNAIQVWSLRFVPTLTIPPRGYVVIHVASQFAPNGRTYWVSTDAVDEGTNDATKLWVDGAPVSNFMKECVGGTEDGAWCDPAEFAA
ncbi:MAG: hypothetical protein Q7R41_16805, partial [Phycisphaerales bacterium]|nr:hypothetical protein [Phycisphaerales bacterium]